MSNIIQGGGAAPAPGPSGISTAALVARTRLYIGEVDEDFFSTADIVSGLNEGKNILFADIDALARKSTLQTVAPVGGQSASEYALPHDFGRLISARIGQATWLKPLDEVEASKYEFAVSASASTPRYVEPYVGSDGSRRIRLHPAPDAVYSIALRYYAIPPNLVLGGQGVSWPAEWAYIPCYYAASVVLEKDRRTAAAADKMAMFEVRKRHYRIDVERRRPVKLAATRSRVTAPSMGAAGNHINI